MKIFIRNIAFLVLMTGCLLVPSSASTNMADTYVARTSRINGETHATSRFLFAPQTEDSFRVEILDSIKLKDPNKAIFYACIPGIVIHGSGHFYAGKTKTGFWLLGAEVVGAYLVFTAALAELPGGEYHPDDELWGFGGLVLFVGSWVYDIIGAPLAVQKYNEQLLRKKTVSLKFDFDETTNSLRFQIIKRF